MKITPEITVKYQPRKGGAKVSKKANAEAVKILAEQRSNQGLATVPQATGYAAGGNIIAIIEKAASNPRFNVEKMERLLSLQERIMAKQAEMAFTEAMTRLQENLPRITKKGRIAFIDKKNNQRDTPYAKYEDIDKAIRPLLLAEGFHLHFDTKWGADGATIYGTLTHRDGHSITSEMRLPLDTSGSKNSLQAMGSTISYGQRYNVKMLLNLIFEDEDTDGAGAPKLVDEGDTFASRVAGDAGVVLDNEPVPADVLQQGEKLKADVGDLKRKRDRLALVNDNLPLLRQLDSAGHAALVQGIHSLVDLGA